MTYPCPRHKGCVRLDTYGYLGEYIENEGQYGHVDLNPLPSKSLLQVLRHGDNSRCDVNRHKDPAKSQKCPGSLLKETEKIKARDSTQGNILLLSSCLRKQKGTVACNIFGKQTDFFSVLKLDVKWRNDYDTVRNF